MRSESRFGSGFAREVLVGARADEESGRRVSVRWGVAGNLAGVMPTLPDAVQRGLSAYRRL